MKTCITALAILFCFCFAAKAQQKAMYTQYMYNALAINPAYAAVDESLAITLLSRHQWVGFKGAPNTQTASIHTPIKESNTFLGALLLRDQIGEVISETGLSLTLSQRVPLNENTYLSVGINGGMSSFQADYSQKFGQSPVSVNDPTFQDQGNFRSNFGFGVSLFTDKYYVGISTPHFYYRDIASIAKNAASTAYRPHYLVQGGYIVDLGRDFKIKPNFLMKYVNGSPIEFDMNTNFLIKEKLSLGASYRSLDSFDGLISYYISPNVQLGYSYDFAHTELAKVQRGSHEVMIQFRLPVKGRDHMACYF